ncbi:hypothetical protein ACSFA0_25370 [Variovorax sp. LT1P1]|uniref:hypothetical protein n=1 Tax=Variovorax sp. LT1P1 TaxID=3443730 RepID=UPI003F44C56C
MRAVSLLLLPLLVGGVAQAQTLEDLANAQRLKQTVEIARLAKEAADAQAELNPPPPPPPPAPPSEAEVRDAARRAAEAMRPRVVLHSLTSRNGQWIAELTFGQRRIDPAIGMTLYGQQIAGVDSRGLLLTKPCDAGHVRRGAQCGTRVLRVGEGF